ncbi:serine dehydratase-like [Dermacentor andersoni]|uniref:serine dehydratase-like n=1 Tax=Dermacentor andersoni TaxID=34620 RepID=UPI002155F4D8|nr:L-serine dehydratase/L-threonine deaminase-like [Dermacentor andersoni]
MEDGSPRPAASDRLPTVGHSRPLHVRTPLLESLPLSEIYGQRVYLKMDNVQPSGSFKIRGMGALCQDAKRKGASKVVIASGGNAGMAVAYGARQLGMESVVVIPHNVPRRMVDKLRLEGARVEVQGNSWDDADERAKEIVAVQGGYYCHPFDHPLIWAGNATMVPEMKEDLVDQVPAAVVASVGGGGLVCGLSDGMEAAGWAQVPIIAVETRGADSFRASLRAGNQVTLPRITSIAAALGVRKVCTRILELYKTRSIFSMVLSDRLAVDACNRFADDHRALVEPACGASLAAVYAARVTQMRCQKRLDPARPLVVVVCGGSAASRQQLEEWTKSVATGATSPLDRDHSGID